jgi:tight adherence protein B
MTAGVLAAVLVAASGVAIQLARTAPPRRPIPAPAPPPTRARGRAPSWLGTRLGDLDVAVSPDLVWRAWMAAVIVVPAAALLFGGVPLAVLAGVAVTATPVGVWRANRGRRDARLTAGLPGALEALARSLRSGAGLRAAIGEAGSATPAPLRTELLRVARTAEAEGVVAALEAWAARRPVPGVRLAVAALCLGAETGGAQARAIDGVATTLRQRLSAAAEARALASQARVSAAVIALAPLAFCALASSTDTRVASFLFRSGAGAAVLTAGLVLDAAGALWMARLTRLPA